MTHARQNKLFLVLSANLVLLGVIALSAWPRGAAVAQVPAVPTVTAGGVAVVPAQLSVSSFGCYLFDAERQTLAVYQYVPGQNDLRLLAARDTSFDRQLKQFNTSPPPAAIQHQLEQAALPPRVAPAPAPKE